jgi:hypothetical protein
MEKQGESGGVDALMERGLSGFAAGKLDAALNAFTEAAALAGSALAAARPKRSSSQRSGGSEVDRGAAFNPFGAAEPAKLLASGPDPPPLDPAAVLALKIVQGRAFGNISNIFFRQGDLSSAILFSEKALGVFNECGEAERAAVILFNLAVFSLGAGQPAAAQGHMEEVLRTTQDPQRREQAQKWLDKHFEGRLLAGGVGRGDEDASFAAASLVPPQMRLPALPREDGGGGELSKEEALLLAHARLGHPDEASALLEVLGPRAVDTCGLRTPLIEACRAPRCSMLHILTVQLLLHRRATVDAVDYLGATALMHAALNCGVCTEVADLACGDDVLKLPLAQRPEPPAVTGTSGVGSSSEGFERAANHPAASSPVALSPSSGTGAGRPRAASDGTPRHLQLVMMLLNAGADPCMRSAAGVSALLLLAASPLSEAVAVFQSVVGRANAALQRSRGGAAAVGGSGGGDAGSVTAWWRPDARGRNVLHYCALAANAEGTRIVLAAVPPMVSRLLVAATDATGSTPVQLLQLRRLHSNSVAPAAEGEGGSAAAGDDEAADASATRPGALDHAGTLRRHSSGDAASVAQSAARVRGELAAAAAATRSTSASSGGDGVLPAAQQQQRRAVRSGGGSGARGEPLQQHTPVDDRRRQMHALFTSVIVGH